MSHSPAQRKWDFGELKFCARGLRCECVGVPYKLADYAAAGLPVVNTLHGETERLLAEHSAGITCNVRDASALRNAVARLCTMDGRIIVPERRNVAHKILRRRPSISRLRRMGNVSRAPTIKH